jgi:protocatechuate 3,4-dioxygenase beta subunit
MRKLGRKIGIAFGISLLLLAGLGFLLFRLAGPGRAGAGRPSGPAGEPVASTAAPIDEPGERDRATPTNPGVAPSVSEAELAGASLSGAVIDDFHAPIAGVRIALVRRSGGAALFGRGGAREGRGRGGRERLYDLIAAREAAAPRPPLPQGELVAETQTDDEGRYAFAIAAIPPGTYRVLAQKEGYGSEGEDWSWEPESSVIDFQLGGGEVIAGIVVDAGEAPIVKAVVVAFPERADAERFGPGGRQGRDGGRGGARRGGSAWRGGDSNSIAAQAETDGDGRFVLHVPSGVFRVAAQATAFRAGSESNVESGTHDLVLALEASAAVLGKVIDAGGQPIAGIAVELNESGLFARASPEPERRGGGDSGERGERSERGRDARERTTMERGGPGGGFRRWFSAPDAAAVTDARGEFRFEDVKTRRFSLLAHGPGYVEGQLSGEVPDDAASQSVTLTLEAAAVLSGTVRDHRGQAVAGAFVAVGSQRDAPPGRGGGRRGRDRQGEEGGRAAAGVEGRAEGQAERGGQGRDQRQASLPEPVSLLAIRAGARTDSDGNFAIDTIPSGQYALSVESEKHPVFRLEPVAVEKKAHLDIELEEGLTLRGRVLSQRSGAAVSRAEMRFSVDGRNERLVRSGEDGAYEVAGLAASVIEEVRVHAPGHSTAYFPDVVIDGGRRDFSLEPAAEVSGQVLDGAGQAVAKARVALSPILAAMDEADPEAADERQLIRDAFRDAMRRSAQARTDAEGGFRFTDVAGGRAYRLSVEHPDYQRLDVEKLDVGAGAQIEGLRLVLAMGARIEVAVQGPDGLAVPGASVRVELQEPIDGEREAAPADSGPRGPESARRRDAANPLGRFGRGQRRESRQRSKLTGPDGRALFAGMLEGPYRIRIESKGFQNAYLETWAAAESTSQVVAALAAEHVLEGRVLALGGTAIDGARLLAVRETPDPLAASAAESGRRAGFGGRGGRGGPEGAGRARGETASGRSRPDGSFRLGQLAASTYTLRVSARGFAELRLEGVPVDRPLELALEPLGAIAGRVVSLETGLPIPSFQVQVRAVREPRPEAGTPRAERGASASAAGGGFGGRGAEARGGGFGERGGGRGRSFRSPDGSFVLEGLEQGSYAVEVTAEGFTGARVPAAVAAGAVTPLLVSLEEGLSVHGVVVERATNAPVPGAAVYLLAVEAPERIGGAADRREGRPSGRPGAQQRFQGAAGRRQRPSSSDERASAAFAALEQAKNGAAVQRAGDDGSFKLAELALGRYLLVVEHEAFLPASREIELANGRLSDYVMALDAGERLSGTITLENGAAAAGLAVLVQSSLGYTRRAQTDAAGNYAVGGLIAGIHSVSVLRESQLLTTLSAEVQSGKNTLDYRHEPDRR